MPRKAPGPATLADLDAQNTQFRDRFLHVVTAGLGAICLVGMALFHFVMHSTTRVTVLLTGAFLCVGVYVLLLLRQRALASYALVVCATAISTWSMWVGDAVAVRTLGANYAMLVVLAAYLIGARGAFAIGVLSLGITVATYVGLAERLAMHDATWWPSGVVVLLMLAVVTVTAGLFVHRAETTEVALRQRLAEIDTVVVRARRVAEGDLSGDIDGQGDVSDVIGKMLRGLRSMAHELRASTQALAASTTEISAMARQQEQGSVTQASAVAQTRATLDSLAGASREITQAAHGVVTSAEATLRNNEVIADRIGVLRDHTRRIDEILQAIKEIATKSELLALNASLEGAKAGDAGKSFSLVAKHMQGLAVSVMQSLGDVRTLVSDIQSAMNAAVLSTEEGTKLAQTATQSARQISIITQQQRSSAEQASRAMDDISEVASQVASGSSQTLRATEALAGLSSRLSEATARFTL